MNFFLVNLPPKTMVIMVYHDNSLIYIFIHYFIRYCWKTGDHRNTPMPDYASNFLVMLLEPCLKYFSMLLKGNVPDGYIWLLT